MQSHTSTKLNLLIRLVAKLLAKSFVLFDTQTYLIHRETFIFRHVKIYRSKSKMDFHTSFSAKHKNSNELFHFKQTKTATTNKLVTKPERATKNIENTFYVSNFVGFSLYGGGTYR